MDLKKKLHKIYASIVFLVLISAILLVSALLSQKSTGDMQAILEDSIEARLLSICAAAEEIIAEYDFRSYTDHAAVLADEENYLEMRARLRRLAKETGATYIYALRFIDRQCLFIVDTDEENEQVFIPYEPEQVHLDAFAGITSAGVMNIVDEYGSFNCGAAPLWIAGELVGVVSVDIEDEYIQRGTDEARRNRMLTMGAMLVVLACMVAFVVLLARRVGEVQAQLETQAHHDSLTGLPNRKYFYEYIEAHIGKGAEPFALLFIDLDNFKQVNDNAGHEVGDALLCSVSTLLQQQSNGNAKSFRPTAGTLNMSARVGGDEFIQVINGVTSAQDAAMVADGLIAAFHSGRFQRFVDEFHVGLSVGVALYPSHAENVTELIRNADAAMYKAKKSGKNQYCIYHPAMEDERETEERNP